MITFNGIVIIDPEQVTCFGGSFGQFLSKYFLGYDMMVISSFKGLLPPGHGEDIITYLRLWYYMYLMVYVIKTRMYHLLLVLARPMYMYATNTFPEIYITTIYLTSGNEFRS